MTSASEIIKKFIHERKHKKGYAIQRMMETHLGVTLSINEIVRIKDKE